MFLKSSEIAFCKILVHFSCNPIEFVEALLYCEITMTMDAIIK